MNSRGERDTFLRVAHLFVGDEQGPLLTQIVLLERDIVSLDRVGLELLDVSCALGWAPERIAKLLRDGDFEELWNVFPDQRAL